MATVQAQELVCKEAGKMGAETNFHLIAQRDILLSDFFATLQTPSYGWVPIFSLRSK